MNELFVGFLAVIALLTSILLMIVILLQEPKGGGLAAALGGSGMEAIGVSTGKVNRFTATVATIWVVACLLHAVLMDAGPPITLAPTPGGPGGGAAPADGGGGGTAPDGE